MPAMLFDFITLFPAVFEPSLTVSVMGRGQAAGLLDFNVHDLRDFAMDKHRTVDDTPYGGGAGMVLKVEPIDRALQSLSLKKKRRIIVLAARGEQFLQTKAEEYAQLEQLIFICGRYEGIDQRVADYLADEELSIGPYVLAGGELGALVVAETVARLVPGVLGNPESLKEESYTGPAQDLTSFAEYPHYTKPEDYKGWKVPEVLLSGNHAEIERWRRARSQ